MLSFLELAISPLGQFKVFSECISLMLLEALKRNYYTFSNILQCCLLYKKKKSDEYVPALSPFVQAGWELLILTVETQSTQSHATLLLNSIILFKHH